MDSGLAIGLLGCKGFAKIAKLSDAILIPCIIVLALILGSLGEKGLHRSFLISDGNPAIFFESPVCIVLINLCFFWNSKSNFHGKTGIKNAEKSD